MATDARQTQELQRQLIELRELLVELMQHQGIGRAGARSGRLIWNREKKVPLSTAVELVWGKHAARKKESLEAHIGILELWATKGMNGIVLETTEISGKAVTSREAVRRFMDRALPTPPTSQRHSGEV